MEGAHQIKTGNLVSLSEQQLVDCSRWYGNQGCNGGLYDYAFKYAKSNPLETESDYPYTGYDGYCQYKSSRAKVAVKSYTNVSPRREQSMKSALEHGPVSVSVQADQDTFMNYSSGILTVNKCLGHRLDHAILAVGWGSENGVDYLIVKNSWGTSWGESGYIRMEIRSS